MIPTRPALLVTCTYVLDIVTIDVAISGWTILVRMTTPASYTTLHDAFIVAGEAGFGFFLIEINALTKSLSAQQYRINCWGGEARTHLTLKQWPCFVIDELWTCSR
ncbi:hypothetical protein Tco_0008759 [Tanacetum coccineum]